MKYRVEIGYGKFLFDNSIDAMTFATTAAEHNVTDDDVTIELIKEAVEKIGGYDE